VQIWTRDEFSRQAIAYWLFETGAGLGVVFISLVVTAAGGVIASQALCSALAPSMKEYATLRAFGVSAGALRRLVLEKTLWLAAAATLTASVAILAIVSTARHADVPAALTVPGILAIATLLFVVTATAAIGGIRLVSRVDTFALLR
jgi:putative ABC transport system permease protein